MLYQILDCDSDILEVTDSSQQWDLSESSEEEFSASSDEPEEVETFVRSASSRKRFGSNERSCEFQSWQERCAWSIVQESLLLSKIYVTNR